VLGRQVSAASGFVFVAVICKVLAMLGVSFTEGAYRQARTRTAANRAIDDAVVVEALLATRRPDPATGRQPRERLYGRRRMIR
jgi:hypothetical protein